MELYENSKDSKVIDLINLELNENILEEDINIKYKHVIYILNACNIICNSFKDLDGLIIPRSLCINNEKYIQIKSELPLLKKFFSSSYLTSLQSTATNKQKFPLLNLIRQLLRSCSYKLIPKRISDGYTVSGEKKYKRMFIVERMII